MSARTEGAPAEGAHLDALEAESVHIVREAQATLDRLALLWSPGPASTVMVWLCRKAFFGDVPFPAVHMDAGCTGAETQAFRARLAAAWTLRLIAVPCPPAAADPSLPATARTAAGLAAAAAEHGFTGVLAGLLRDGADARAGERVFSPRGRTGERVFRGRPPEFWEQYDSTVPAGGHVRVHPLLRWSEVDIRGYAAREGIPVPPLDVGREDGAAPRCPLRHEVHGPVAALDAMAASGAAGAPAALPFRMPVQGVYGVGGRRIVAGRIASGRVRVGDRVLFSPSNETARVAAIETWNVPKPVTEAAAGASIGLALDRPLTVERGEMASHQEQAPIETDVFRARLCWFGRTPLRPGRRLTFRLGPASAGVEVQSIDPADTDTARTEIPPAGATRTKIPPVAAPRAEIPRDGIAGAVLRSRAMLALDEYAANARTGRFVLEDGKGIAGAGLIGMEGYPDQRALVTGRSTNVGAVAHGVNRAARAKRNGHAGGVIWLTGLSGAGKSTLAIAAEDELFRKGYQVYALDGDNLRHGLNATLGFSPEDRAENIRRVGEVAALFAEAGFVVLTAFISPYRSDRQRARAAAARARPEGFHEVYVRAPLAVCEARDPKGLYRRARAGEIADFTGVSAPYEAPDAPELTVETGDRPVADSLRALLDYVERAFTLTAGETSEG